MIRVLLLAPNLRSEIEREARTAFPRECCGLIEGVRTGEQVQAFALHPTRNIAQEPNRFEIDPAAHIALMRNLRGTGREIVGCYHSHPDGAAEPSQHDRRSASEDGFVWVIAAVARETCELRAYVHEGEDFRGLDLA